MILDHRGMPATDTVAVHAARADLSGLGVHVPPIDLSTTYPMPDIESGGEAYDLLAAGGRPDADTPLVYQRLWSPNADRFERAIAELEECDQGAAFATGMAAVSAVLLACVAAGTPQILAVRPLYGGTDHILATGLLGTEVVWVEPDEIADAITDRTGLVMAETPANPTLDLLDIAAICRAAGPVPVMIDNTFATPVLQQPARHGATLVLHSATKYLGGHGDVMGGVVCGPTEWIARIRSVRALTGGVLHPMAAYELHRGLQTLPTRVRSQQRNARTLAAWLTDQPQVSRVFYPAVTGGDPSGLIGSQMAGPGSVVAVDMTGGYAAASHLVRHVRLITHAVSLGGVDTLVEHPASLTHRFVDEDARPHAGVVRFSVGLEDASDLIADVAAAMPAPDRDTRLPRGSEGLQNSTGRSHHGASAEESSMASLQMSRHEEPIAQSPAESWLARVTTPATGSARLA